MSAISVGSVCSGIEAASVAWKDSGFEFKWFSEISEFPSNVLRSRYPHIPNLGDMCEIPQKLLHNHIESPDLICGGTPCQAFSLAGWKKGLGDHRGNLTLKFVDIVEENDRLRSLKGLAASLVFWENVEGVLRDKTNAFGCFLASLAGFETEIAVAKWPQAGLIHGPKRNIAWRVLDAKYFGLPQQRRRLYVLAGGKEFYPEQVLFESDDHSKATIEHELPLKFFKQGHSIEVFRSYTDCLYSAYGTKWNGNAAAYNGSLFVCQNARLRRFTPLECERLMGLPDHYTNLSKVKPTARYQGVGNSWAVPVVRWLGTRISGCRDPKIIFADSDFGLLAHRIRVSSECTVLDLSKSPIHLANGHRINCSDEPSKPVLGNLFDVIDVDAAENFYITPAGCKGILRRKEERRLSMNPRLEEVLRTIASMWSDEKIEEISRRQSRGRFSFSKAKLDYPIELAINFQSCPN
jgi:DNA (cytosine-5)-methyltransferase 1